MAKPSTKKVLLIGWDAADWKAIHPLMDAGYMPTMEKFINEGVMGNLTTLDPPLSPMLWTSISTGKRPYQHGILGFSEPDPSGAGVRPSQITSRKVKAIWNMLMQEGKKPHQVGWWPSHPAEPINGCYVSNFYQKASKPITEPWPMAPGTVHPKEMEDIFAKLRIHPQELTAAHLLPFIPNGANLDQSDPKNQQILNSLRSILADTATIHSAATYIMDNEEWDFLGVYYDGIDHFGHGFMKYHPPKMDRVSQEDYDMWNNVVTAGYRFHDMMLKSYLDRVDEDTTVILVSDHGFHPDHLRPKEIPKEPAGPAAEHSMYGVIVAKGPGIKKDDQVFGASLLDITPTILSMFGLPVGEDMDGKVLSTLFETPPVIETIPSWENREGDCGMHPKDMQEDPYAAKEAMEQLIALGYIDRPDENSEEAIRKTVAENNFYLARSYINGQKHEEAIPILEKLWEDMPEALRFGTLLSRCYLKTQDLEKARTTVQKIRSTQKEPKAGLYILQGEVVLAERKPKKALEYFRKAEELDPDVAGIHTKIGHCYHKLERWEDSLRAYEKDLVIDPENNVAWVGVGQAYLRMAEYDKAIEPLLKAIGLQFYTPFAHYFLGETLFYLEEYQESANAFEVCLRLVPGLVKAKEWLVKIYDNHLDSKEMGDKYRDDIPDRNAKEVIVVSGLPRSGTSMMMQMLKAGGIEPFTDNVRQPDTNNPKGYYEHEAVKSLMRDPAFLEEVDDKVVKVISHLLFKLPKKYNYKIVFMERDIEEVIASQHKMLVRTGKAKKETYPTMLKKNFKETLDRIKGTFHYRPNVEFLFVPHKKVIEDPLSYSKRIERFLDKKMDVNAMAAVIDKSLHREKNSELVN